MTIPILATKLYRPQPAPAAVERPALVARLNAGIHRKLTLVSAPAGFGKTTLISAWLARTERRVAWLSLGEEDGSPERFLHYVIAALQTLDPQVGRNSATLLQASPAPMDAILTALLNEIAAQPAPIVLVLDDYHLLDAAPVDEVLAFLLAHLPRQLHLVINTRQDPDLPLARLRARGQLTELRAGDLRFTPDEAALFLNQTMGLDLTGEEMAALETRTEGWIAGLQLAALSLQGRTDRGDFVQAFAGDHRYIVDYLVDEVLCHQPETIRRFLLQSAVLARLNGPLCAAVTEMQESGALLETLERNNLFVIPLDDNRQWYRYHHLFADVLHTRLMDEAGISASDLHARASRWFEANGFPADAVRHALAAGDDDLAAHQIELTWRAMDGSFQSAAWFAWAQRLPAASIRARPVLCVGSAWAYLNSGRLEEADLWLREAEGWIDDDWNVRAMHSVRGSEHVASDQAELCLLPATIAAARAYQSMAHGRMESAVEYARRALSLYPEQARAERGVPLGILGIEAWTRGNLAAARTYFIETMAGFEARANFPAALSVAYGLGEIEANQGKLTDAERTYQRALQWVADLGDPILPGLAELHAGLGELHRLRGDTQAARTHLQQIAALDAPAVLPGDEYRLYATRARLEAALGNRAGALELLDEAERLQIRTPMPDVRPAAATRARILLAEGETAKALTWAESRSLTVDDELNYLQEYEHITLARILMARFKAGQEEQTLHAAIALLERLLAAAEEGDRLRSVIEILILQSTARHAHGKTEAAVASLQRALLLAEPEGYVSLFVDEGAAMAELLRVMEEQDSASGCVARLQAVFVQTEANAPAAGLLTAQPLIDPLSERELEVLYLLDGDLSGPEIARTLVISLNTLRTHTKNIYAKLDVNSRRAAVHRARELSII